MTSTTHGGSGRGDPAWIEVSTRPDCVVVTVGGELDLQYTAQLAHTLQAVATESPAMIVDLTDLTFMDSSGLGVLISARNRAQALSTSLALVHPPPLVRRLLAGTRLHQSFAVYDTLDEGLAAVRRS